MAWLVRGMAPSAIHSRGRGRMAKTRLAGWWFRGTWAVRLRCVAGRGGPWPCICPLPGGRLKAALIATESTLTDRHQTTTVPEPVRIALGLTKSDKISCVIRGDGEAVLTRVQPEEDADAALEPLLQFLAQDIARHTEHLLALDTSLLMRVQALTRGVVVVVLDAPLPAASSTPPSET